MSKILRIISGDAPYPLLAALICLILLSLIYISDELISDKWIQKDGLAQKEISPDGASPLDLLGMMIFSLGSMRLAASLYMLIITKSSNHYRKSKKNRCTK